MARDFSLLDNPIWSALTTAHILFSVGAPEVKKYREDIIPFLGMANGDAGLLKQIEPFMAQDEEVFLKEENLDFPSGWAVVTRLNCLQMVYEPASVDAVNMAGIVKLTVDDAEELSRLVNLVQPGFFKRNTSLLGDYFGIKKEGELVAVAGERFKMTGFSELSAVCTHPEHTGKGYAQQLLEVLCNKNLEEGDIPFLHVADTNERAIKIYERLGFRKRMDLPLVKVKMG